MMANQPKRDPVASKTCSEPTSLSHKKEITVKKNVKRENIFVNLLVNIVVPTVILSKFSGENALGVQWALVVALMFPIAYGLFDIKRSGKFNFFSALGIFSIMMTGGMALLELPPKYIMIKEAAIPAIFGLVTLISLKTRYPLIRTFLFNEAIMQVDKVSHALDHYGVRKEFDQVLVNASYLMALSFGISSVLNYILAKVLLVSAPGTEAFNAELAKMNALSFPLIAVPATIVMVFALFYIFKRIKALTHLDLEDIIVHP